jgi:cytochrome P450
MGEDFSRLDGARPLVGHMPEMYRHFPELVARGVKAHGPLFWIQGGPGAEQLMLATRDGALLLKDKALSTSFYAEGFGPMLAGTLFVFDGAEHQRVRGLMAPAFTPKRIGQTKVIRVIDEVATRTIERWVERGYFDAVVASKEYALEIIFRLLGVPGEHLDAFRVQFERYRLCAVPSEGWVLSPLVWAGVRARDWIDERFGAMVDRCREEGDETTLLGAIANRRDEAGRLIERKLVVANLRLLVLAGHETTAATLAWTLLHAATDPRLQEQALALSLDPDDDGKELDRAGQQFLEAARLYPTVHSVIRRTTAPLMVEGREVPAGILVNVPLVHMLRDPERFPEPSVYRPQRWQDWPKPGSVRTAMFGGGPHFCLGYHIALAEGTRFHRHLAAALCRHGRRLRRHGAVPPPVFLPLAHPPGKHTISLERAPLRGFKGHT